MRRGIAGAQVGYAACEQGAPPGGQGKAGAPVGEAGSVRAMTAEPLAMPQPGHLARPKATHAGAAAGRSTAPESVQVPLLLSISVYISV